MFARLTCFLSMLLIPLGAFAQPLANKVPATALIYVGWQGVDSMPAAYQQSHLKAVLDQSNIPAVVNDLLPRLLAKVGQQDPGAAAKLDLVGKIATAAWKHPTVLYMLPPEWPAAPGAPPTPKAAVLCQAGNDADGLLQQLNLIADQLKGGPFPVKAFKLDDVVGFEIGFADPAQAVAGAGVPAITGSAGFNSALAQVHKDAVGICYVDVEGLVATIEQGVKLAPPAQQMWPMIRDAIGLNGLKRIVATCGFDGQDWGGQLFVAAPAPRTGLLAMIDNAPLTDDLLKTIPKTATMMSAGRADLAKLVAQIRLAAVKFNPNAQQDLDAMMGAVNAQFGIDIQKDILEPLGDQWAAYTDPESTGSGLLGFVLINRLNKPAEAEQSLGKLSTLIQQLVKQNAPPDVTVRFDEVKVGSNTIHYVSVPLVSPSWAIKDGNLYMGLYPQVVSAALDSGGAGKSILDNPNFVAIRTRLGGQKASSISFIDLPRSTAGGYQLLLAGSQLGLGAADMLGVKTPPMVLPPLAKLREHMGPAGSVVWTDDEGLHMRSVTPFPGAEMVASPLAGMGAAAPAMAVSVLLPALNAARERAARVASSSNLRQIGMGVIMYNEQFNKYPPDLGTLVTKEDLSPRVFISASSGTQAPPLTGDEAAKWVNANSDYVYLGASLNRNAGADTIVAYEKPEIHRGQGMNVLFNDGHVEWRMVGDAMAQIDKQKK